jgi:hypothetical protein
MNENFEVEPEVLKAKMTAETAQIQWLELQKFYASGQLLFVSSNLDLIDVAFALATNDQDKVACWLSMAHIFKVTDDQALLWYQQQQILWAVVVSPWVLVQLPEEIA